MAIAHLGAVWALRGARAVPLPAVPLKREPRTVADHLVDYAHAPAATTNTNSTTGKQPLLAPYGGGTAMVKADGYVSLPSPGTVPMDFFLQQLRLLAIDRLPPVDALPGACDVLDAGVRCYPLLFVFLLSLSRGCHRPCTSHGFESSQRAHGADWAG